MFNHLFKIACTCSITLFLILFSLNSYAEGPKECEQEECEQLAFEAEQQAQKYRDRIGYTTNLIEYMEEAKRSFWSLPRRGAIKELIHQEKNRIVTYKSKLNYYEQLAASYRRLASVEKIATEEIANPESLSQNEQPAEITNPEDLNQNGELAEIADPEDLNQNEQLEPKYKQQAEERIDEDEDLNQNEQLAEIANPEDCLNQNVSWAEKKIDRHVKDEQQAEFLKTLLEAHINYLEAKGKKLSCLY